jgi:alkanesulfonate monooxygenase SsuD/methylene tetrahydromethanopterin reductase-like flavin-dependent oxidoreductase (luciferase family)
MNLMFTQDKATYTGKHFSIEDLRCEPKPLQDPFPICVGARGEDTLKMATRYAHLIDIYGVDKRTLKNRLELIRNCCTEYGRKYEDIVKSWGCWFLIYEDEHELKRYSAELDRLTLLRKGRSTGITRGTPEEIVAMFKELVDMGISYFTLRFEDLPSKRGIRLFAEEVMPHFR